MTQLSAAEAERLRSWAVAIAETLAGAKFTDRGSDRHFAGYGGLEVHRALGCWRCFAENAGGWSTIGLIRFLRKCDQASATAWAHAWLSSHAGTGSCTGTVDDDGDASGVRASASAAAARAALDATVPLDHKDAEPARAYLKSRGLLATGQDSVRYLPASTWLDDLHRPGEGALVTALSAGGVVVGAQLTWLTPSGTKSTVVPVRQTFLLDHERGREGVFELIVPHGQVWDSQSAPDRIVVEGLENGLALSLAGAAPNIHGLPGVGRLRHIAARKGERISVFRDGDRPGSAADRSLIAGIDAMLLQGAEVRVTLTPAGADGNSILLAGGVEPLHALLTDAVPAQLSLDGEVQRLAVMDPADSDPLLALVAKRFGIYIPTLRSKIKAARPKPATGEDKSQSDTLASIGQEAELFHTPDGAGYADVMVDDHRETWALASPGFRRWLAHRYYEETAGAPNSEALRAALNVLEAKAVFNGPKRPVHVRVGELDGKIYLDLTNADWQAIELDALGWRVVGAPPVRFRRPKGSLPLPQPAAGASIAGLRTHLNLKSDADFVLVIAWLLAALRDHGPYPVLALAGEAGAAKSTCAALLRAVVDPHVSPLRSLPREDRDLFVSAANSHLLVFDNLSGLPHWISDTLCRLATGGGHAVRQLYSDQDETLFEGARPLMLTGIEDVISRQDLASGAIFLTLEPIAEAARKTEAGLWAAFDGEHPAILGGLLDLVVVGLRRLPHTKLAFAPRLADFARWATACTSELWGPDAFAAAYANNGEQALLDTIDADPVATAVCGMMEAVRTVRTQTAAAYLYTLNTYISDDIRRSRAWPKTPRAVAGRLRRAAPSPRKIGIEVVFSRAGHDRARLITITRVVDTDSRGDLSSASSALSAQPDNFAKSAGSAPQGVDGSPATADGSAAIADGSPIDTVRRRVAADAADGSADSPELNVRANSLKINGKDGADGADGEMPLPDPRAHDAFPDSPATAAGNGAAPSTPRQRPPSQTTLDIRQAVAEHPDWKTSRIARHLGHPEARVKRALAGWMPGPPGLSA